MRFNMYVPHARKITFVDNKDGGKRKTMHVPAFNKGQAIESVSILDIIPVTYGDAVARRLNDEAMAPHVTQYDIDMMLYSPDAPHIGDTLERAKAMARGCRVELAE